VVTTFFRGSHVAINGPAAGLIVVVLAGVQSLADENGSGFPYVLAAIVVAGVIQMILGLLKMGKLGDLFPASVVNGMLATIGVIIFVKQFHVALGVHEVGGTSLDALLEIPKSLLNLNPTVTFISVISLLILILHPYIKNNFLKSIPAPLQVLIVAVPLVAIIDNIPGLKEISILNYPVYFGPDNLVKVPQNLLDNFIYPDFSKIGLPEFWVLVISITLVASIETLISTKAVDKLDHFKRRTNLNKDLFAVGLSTTVSGFLGGLPIITVIVRSSVNVNHKAKTKWSNFYHGILLLSFVFLFPFIIREIPLASLATILVYTGYKLASPKVFQSTLLKGWEQLVILVSTLLASLAIDLLWGIIFGIFTTLLIHWMRSQLHIKTFIRHLIHTDITTVEESKNVVHVEIKGIANFAIMLKLINLLTDLGNGKHFIVDFGRTKLVDSTILDFIHEHREKYFTQTYFEFTGLDVHRTSSPHPLALHILKKPMQKRLTSRQNDVNHFASENRYLFKPEINWLVEHFEKFRFFEYHLMEYQRNRMEGSFDRDISWIVSDVTYNDGIFMASEEHHITVMIMTFPEESSDFCITKDDIRNLKAHIKSSEKSAVLPKHLTEFGLFLDENASYCIERVGKEVMIFRKERLLSAKEIVLMHDYVKKLCDFLPDDQSSYILLEKYFK
jgi:MFS superfamily sulfate permease-like transporter